MGNEDMLVIIEVNLFEPNVFEIECLKPRKHACTNGKSGMQDGTS